MDVPLLLWKLLSQKGEPRYVMGYADVEIMQLIVGLLRSSAAMNSLNGCFKPERPLAERLSTDPAREMQV